MLPDREYLPDTLGVRGRRWPQALGELVLGVLGWGGSASFACGAEAQTNHAACRRFAEQLLSASRPCCMLAATARHASPETPKHTRTCTHGGQTLVDPRGMNSMSQDCSPRHGMMHDMMVDPDTPSGLPAVTPPAQGLVVLNC